MDVSYRFFVSTALYGLPVALTAGIVAPPPVGLAAPVDVRAVLGQTVTSEFTLTNTSPDDAVLDIDYTASTTGNGSASGSLVELSQPDGAGGVLTEPASGAPWIGANLAAGNSGTLRTSTDLTNSLAGDVVRMQVTALDQSLLWPAQYAFSDINVVTNRLLTGSTTIDAGRHMVGLLPVGAVNVSGGAWTDDEATRISINSGGYAQFTNGLRLTSASDMTFNGAGQTHDLQVAYNGPTGTYSINTALPSAGESTYTDAGGAEQQDFGGAWKTSAEYGNAFGETQVFTEEDDAGWRNDGTGPTYGLYSAGGGDYVYAEEVVETAQPTIREVRSGSNATGLTTQWELDRGAGPLVNERIDPLIQGEVIQGSSLDLSGVSVNLTGTAVANRVLRVDSDQNSSNGSGPIDLGRRMLGAANETVSRNDTVYITTSGSDDQYTRLSVGSFTAGDAALTAMHDQAADFDEESDFSAVQLSADFSIDTSVQGRVTQYVQVGSHITGEGLVGESVQSNLNVGYHWNNVANNELISRDLLIIEREGATGTRQYNQGFDNVGRKYSTETHTAITHDATVQVSGSRTAGLHNLGNQTVNATAEGLVGEVTTASTTFNKQIAVIEDGSYSAAHDGAGSAMTDGDVLTITDTGTGIYQNDIVLAITTIEGSDNLEYQLIYGGGSAQLQHGESRTLEVDYIGDTTAPLAGELSRVSKADLSIALYDQLNESEINAAWGRSDVVNGEIASGSEGMWNVEYGNSPYSKSLGTLNYKLETRFDAPAAATGTSQVESGSDFGVAGLALTNSADNKSDRFTEDTSAELVDSNTLGSDVEVSLSFVKLESAAAGAVDALENSSNNAGSVAGMLDGSSENSEFVSEIVELDGLDGILHVLEVTYDDSNLLNGDSGVQLVWSTTYGDPAQQAWVNAVLGNSNITELDLLLGTLKVDDVASTIQDYLALTRYAGGYEDYLADGGLTDPELGAWGVDTLSNKAWAVIDHNSDFAAAVPESATYALIAGMMVLGATVVRRRR